MCRNIKTLFNFDPPATSEEIQASSRQFVRKISGFNKPSESNQVAFEIAVNKISDIARELLDSLDTNAPAKNREAETAKIQERARKRFNTAPRN